MLPLQQWFTRNGLGQFSRDRFGALVFQPVLLVDHWFTRNKFWDNTREFWALIFIPVLLLQHWFTRVGLEKFTRSELVLTL